MPSLNNPSSPSSPTHQVMKKRSSPSVLVSPPKKGHGVTVESVELSDITPSKAPVFTAGYFEKSPARAMFKAARKGKTNKLVSIVLDSEATSEKKEGFFKPPQ
jgi:hypothetical protein